MDLKERPEEPTEDFLKVNIYSNPNFNPNKSN